MLIREPYTKAEFEEELLTLAPREADSRRELWTLCEVFQSIEDIGQHVSDNYRAPMQEVLARSPDDRAEGFRNLRHKLLEEMAESQRR